jgi:hypothetical protein
MFEACQLHLRTVSPAGAKQSFTLCLRSHQIRSIQFTTFGCETRTLLHATLPKVEIGYRCIAPFDSICIQPDLA